MVIKQVVVKQKTKIHTEARYFALTVGLNSTIKERKCNKEFVKNYLFLKVNKQGVQRRYGVLKTIKKLGGGTFIRHLRVSWL